MRAAVTGGAGFVGAALVDKLLQGDWTIAALARDPGKFAPRNGLHLTAGDLGNAEALDTLARGSEVFFHVAGVTHSRKDGDYFDVNVAGAARAAAAASRNGATFIHISSLSARAPETSVYARSKFESEAAVVEASGRNPWIILRLPAIYGPRDRATLPYFRLVKAGFAPEPKIAPPARATLLFVADAADAIIAARHAPARAVYEVGDECAEGRAWSEVGAILGDVLGGRAKPVRAPRAAVAAIAGLARRLESAVGRNPGLRAGQVDEFFEPDWVARNNLLNSATSWRPQTSLREGFAKTVRWYQENGLL